MTRVGEASEDSRALLRETSVRPASLILREVTKWYGAILGVHEVTLEIGPGITGLLGPNGAGKSTLLGLLSGRLRPSVGEVLVGGFPVRRSTEARRLLGYTPETDGFWEEMSGFEFVRAMALLSGLSRREARRRASDSLERVGLSGGAATKRLGACSKGMRQRVRIAQALVHDPPILILDEPLSGIDPAGRIEMTALLKELGAEGKTIVISTHILEEVERSTDRLVLMARGRVLATGTLARIRELLSEHPLAVRVAGTRMRELAAALLSLSSVVGVSVEEVERAEAGLEAKGEAKDLEKAEEADKADPPPSSSVPPVEGGRGRASGECCAIVVRVRRSDAFFAALPSLAVSLGADVQRIETLDASAEAIFHYLVEGRSASVPGVPAP
jgi:ABC-2 type transport system ATP-binding protein